MEELLIYLDKESMMVVEMEDCVRRRAGNWKWFLNALRERSIVALRELLFTCFWS